MKYQTPDVGVSNATLLPQLYKGKRFLIIEQSKFKQVLLTARVLRQFE